MKKYLVIILFLMGCDSVVTSEMYEKATKICKNNGGVNYVNIAAIDSATCQNGMFGYLILDE